MNEQSVAERADRLSRRRARILPLLAAIYLTQQLSFFSALDPAGEDTARLAKTGAWLVLTVLLLAGVASRGFWLEKSETRALLDDELTRSNRLEAMRTGFIVAIVTAIVVVLLAMVEPVKANEAGQLVISFGLGAALIRFGFLERKGHTIG